MDDHIGADALRRLQDYLSSVGDLLGNKCRRASFATYAYGLLGDGERKSMEPIAARACGGHASVDAIHQRLGHFVNDSEWSDRDVRRHGTRYALAELTAREPARCSIIDDTGFLKQGTHSVGVQRQYTGSAGKITNCQIGVSLTIATNSQQLPIDFELYMPREWMADPVRRKEARVPESLQFQTKWQLALGMIERAAEDKIPLGTVLADADYGDRVEFRAGLRMLHLDYAVGIHAQRPRAG
jgi:SRSO17 transposase